MRFSRLTPGARWIDTAPPSGDRRPRRAPGWIRGTALQSSTSAARLWRELNPVTVRCAPTRPGSTASLDVAYALAGLEPGPLLAFEYLVLGEATARPGLVVEATRLAAARAMPPDSCRLVGDLLVCELERPANAPPLSGRARARHIGVHPEQWRRHWARGYESLYPVVAAWEVTATAHVSRRLR